MAVIRQFVATVACEEQGILNSNIIDQLCERLIQNGAKRTTTKRHVQNKAADIFCVHSDLKVLQAAFRDGIGAMPVDVLIQPLESRRKKLLIADMESTIIEQEMLDELAELLGLRDHVAAITRRGMNGEIDFADSLRERTALLKGQPESILYQVASHMTFMPGAGNLVSAMKSNGAQCWLVSGGFDYFGKIVAERLGFDRVVSNKAIIRDGVLTGEVADPIRDAKDKKSTMFMACNALNIPLSDCLAIGDGANDIPMLAACNDGDGLGVAYKAKDAVRNAIAPQINHTSLETLIYAQTPTPP